MFSPLNKTTPYSDATVSFARTRNGTRGGDIGSNVAGGLRDASYTVQSVVKYYIYIICRTFKQIKRTDRILP